MSDAKWRSHCSKIRKALAEGRTNYAAARILEIHQAGRALPQDIMDLLPGD